MWLSTGRDQRSNLHSDTARRHDDVLYRGDPKSRGDPVNFVRRTTLWTTRDLDGAERNESPNRVDGFPAFPPDARRAGSFRPYPSFHAIASESRDARSPDAPRPPPLPTVAFRDVWFPDARAKPTQTPPNARDSWLPPLNQVPASNRRLQEPSVVPASSPAPQETIPTTASPQQPISMSTSDATKETVSSLSSSGTASSPPVVTTGVPKQSRYLRELDRRVILSRLDKGERQSTLAKEYGVSRSTICNLFRQRDIVLARTHENPLARHPKKARKSPMSAPDPNAPTAERRVIEVDSRAISLLKQSLQHRRTSPDQFKHCSARLMRLLLEESLAIATLEAERKHTNVCAVSMETAGRAMLDAFHCIEPHAASGDLEVPGSDRRVGSPYSSLPTQLHGHEVLLLDAVAGSSAAVRIAIEALVRRGAAEDAIALVALFVSAEVGTFVQRAFPRVRIITTDCDASLTSPRRVVVQEPTDSRELLERSPTREVEEWRSHGRVGL